jgi:hypothetical protein
MGQGGDAAQQGQSQGESGQQNGEAQAAPDWNALSSQLEQLAGGQEEMRQFLSSNPWEQQQQEAPAEQQPSEVDLSFLDPADPAYDPENMSQQITAAFGQYMQQAVEQGTAPVVERMQEMQREQAARDLVGEFPDLQDPETAKEVVGASHEYASALGRPDLGNDPQFWRLVYLSGRAIHSAQQEGSGDPGAAHLEGGGGPATGGAQVDPVQAILNGDGKKGAGVLPF